MNSHNRDFAKHWHFIVYDPDSIGLSFSRIKLLLSDYPCYCCMAKGKHEKGLEHIHGFVSFDSPVRRGAIKRLLPVKLLQSLSSCNYEAERGYLAKHGKLYEFGKRPKT